MIFLFDMGSGFISSLPADTCLHTQLLLHRGDVGFYSGAYVCPAAREPGGMAISRSSIRGRWQRSTRAGEDGEHREKVTKQLVSIGFLPICCSCSGEDLFTFFFGAKWAEAGVYIRSSLSDPHRVRLHTLSSVLTVLQKMRMVLIYNSILIILRIVSLATAGRWATSTSALRFSVVAAYRLVLAVWILKAANVPSCTFAPIPEMWGPLDAYSRGGVLPVRAESALALIIMFGVAAAVVYYVYIYR